ncbi:MAG: polyprenyl synthetase family protein [Euryarchaeota archaeon]|jgi:geranylgeranyl diphosphate synthase type I|nr:polyprenyl synthetase family protein [Euryarchaeota archaeon]
MDLQTELTKRAEMFNIYWQQYLLIKKPTMLYEASQHLPSAGGKRIRPFLTMTSCESVSGEIQKALPLAAGLELIHNFTLVHDDIMDHSLLRRNIPAVHVKFGEPSAILAGDLLFAKAFEAILGTSVDFSTFKHLQQDFINGIIAICEGQQLDMEFEQRKTVTEQEYLDMISKKTGALFELAGKGGGLIGGGNPSEVAALQTYGMTLGLAFQIWDDYLDMSSTATTLGKDIGNDIRNGKKTLIAVHSLTHATGKHRKLLDDVFGNHVASEQDVALVYDLFRDLGSIEYAQQRAMHFVTQAKDAITLIKPSDAKELLYQLIEYTIQREK